MGTIHRDSVDGKNNVRPLGGVGTIGEERRPSTVWPPLQDPDGGYSGRTGRPRAVTADWPGLVERILGSRAPSKHAAILWSQMCLAGGHTRKTAVWASYYVCEYDRITPEQRDHLLEIASRYECVVWETASSTPEKPKLRILFMTSRRVHRREWRALVRAWVSIVGVEPSPESYRTSLGWYWPCAWSDRWHFRGQVLDVDEWLALGGGIEPEAAPRTVVHVDLSEHALNERVQRCRRRLAALQKIDGRDALFGRVFQCPMDMGITDVDLAVALIMEYIRRVDARHASTGEPFTSEEVREVVEDTLRRRQEGTWGSPVGSGLASWTELVSARFGSAPSAATEPEWNMPGVVTRDVSGPQVRAALATASKRTIYIVIAPVAAAKTTGARARAAQPDIETVTYVGPTRRQVRQQVSQTDWTWHEDGRPGQTPKVATTKASQRKWADHPAQLYIIDEVVDCDRQSQSICDVSDFRVECRLLAQSEIGVIISADYDRASAQIRIEGIREAEQELGIAPHEIVILRSRDIALPWQVVLSSDAKCKADALDHVARIDRARRRAAQLRAVEVEIQNLEGKGDHGLAAKRRRMLERLRLRHDAEAANEKVAILCDCKADAKVLHRHITDSYPGMRVAIMHADPDGQGVDTSSVLDTHDVLIATGVIASGVSIHTPVAAVYQLHTMREIDGLSTLQRAARLRALQATIAGQRPIVRIGIPCWSADGSEAREVDPAAIEASIRARAERARARAKARGHERWLVQCSDHPLLMRYAVDQIARSNKAWNDPLGSLSEACQHYGWPLTVMQEDEEEIAELRESLRVRLGPAASKVIEQEQWRVQGAKVIDVSEYEKLEKKMERTLDDQDAMALFELRQFYGPDVSLESERVFDEETGETIERPAEIVRLDWRGKYRRKMARAAHVQLTLDGREEIVEMLDNSKAQYTTRRLGVLRHVSQIGVEALHAAVTARIVRDVLRAGVGETVAISQQDMDSRAEAVFSSPDVRAMYKEMRVQLPVQGHGAAARRVLDAAGFTWHSFLFDLPRDEDEQRRWAEARARAEALRPQQEHVTVYTVTASGGVCPPDLVPLVESLLRHIPLDQPLTDATMQQLTDPWWAALDDHQRQVLIAHGVPGRTKHTGRWARTLLRRCGLSVTPSAVRVGVIDATQEQAYQDALTSIEHLKPKRRQSRMYVISWPRSEHVSHYMSELTRWFDRFAQAQKWAAKIGEWGDARPNPEGGPQQCRAMVAFLLEQAARTERDDPTRAAAMRARAQQLSDRVSQRAA